MPTEQDTETIKKGHALSLLKDWLLKFELNPNLLAVLSPECVLQPFSDNFRTHELNTFVLQSAAFYQNFDGESKDVLKEFTADFGSWWRERYRETSKIFLEVLKNTLRYRGVYTGNGESICNQLYTLSYCSRRLAWDEEDLQRSFKQLSPAFQEEVISKGLLPKDVLSTLVTKQQSSTENEVKSIVKEDHSKEVESEEDHSNKVESEEDHSNKVESEEDHSNKVESEAKDKSSQSNDANVTVLDKATKTHRTEADCLIQFAEIWRNEDDYTGDLFDNLDYKIKEFKWIMNILQIESDYWPYCFQYILRKQAKHFARDNFKGELSFDQMVEALKDQFETAETKQYHRFIWTNVTFKSIESENPTKSKSEVLQTLITKIRACQFALGDQYAANVHIVDCLLRACRDEPYLALAYDNIPKNFEAACAVLHKALEGRTRFNGTTSVFTDESSTID